MPRVLLKKSRLKSVLNKLISYNQTGFLKGRYIGTNIRLVLDMINYCNTNNINGSFILLDFEKAFDSLDRKFMDNVLLFFKFGYSFRRWVETFYSNACSCVINNGFHSDFFPVCRGVRQGCPLSPYIFILCTEILCLRIKQDASICGIYIDNNEIKISQYADDTILFTDGSKSSIDNVVTALHDFQSVSGLVINYDKSLLFPVGVYVDHRPLHVNDRNFKISNGPIKYLGISFSHHEEDFFRLNYVPKLSRLKNILGVWSGRDLTPLGKITLIKTFALSQLVYLFTVLPNPPSSYITELNRILFNFIWNGKPDKIKRSVLINNINEGGLKMFHIESFIKSLKCSWVRRLSGDLNQDWMFSFHIALRKFGGIFVFNCNLHPRDMLLLLKMIL